MNSLQQQAILSKYMPALVKSGECWIVVVCLEGANSMIICPVHKSCPDVSIFDITSPSLECFEHAKSKFEMLY